MSSLTDNTLRVRTSPPSDPRIQCSVFDRLIRSQLLKALDRLICNQRIKISGPVTPGILMGVRFRPCAPLEDAGLPLKGPTPLLLDSKSAIDLAYDPVAFKKTKHIMRAAAELRDRVAREIFTPTYVEAAAQIADVLTKGLGPTAHKIQLVRLLNEEPL